MYGQIHCVIRELVLKRFGKETWGTVLAKSGLDEHQSFLMFTRYDDASTFALVGAVSETLEVSVEMVLEIFGEFFFEYCLCHGYDKMLRTLGSDIKSFIQNLDSLHSLLAMSYKGISAPSFRCEDGEDGDLILHYYSGRPGLYPIVKGVLRAVARDLFHHCLEMTVIEQNKENIGFNQTQEHTAFRCQLTYGNGRSTPESPNSEAADIRSVVEFNPETILLKASDFCSAFPYHIIFNRNLKIRQCGVLIQKHSHVTLHDGTPLDKAFEIVHPRMVLSIENIRKFINAVFLLAIIAPSQNGKKTMVLKGQMMWIRDTQMMIFIGSPRLTSLNELMEMNVYLADIPLYDVTRELVLLNQQRIAEIDIAKKLDETTAELKKTWQALKQEKLKTETLLHQMLPRKVAKALTNNQKVEAEKFGQVTILFSDIVTFTNIAAACSPMDIVNMLNDMYQRFDARTSLHNVYKVETIGDAYMIVSGVPEQTNVHAQPVANFAMDMIEDAGLVKSPATGRPLQIRVGVHTGPVVAGVVGVKMPRYCLFGDTVNTASRMESHGVPGRIHLSPTTYEALRGWGYAFKHRGDMDIKGKGRMPTYFLTGHLERRLVDPPDDFCDLDVHVDDTDRGFKVEWHPSAQDTDDSLDDDEDRTTSTLPTSTDHGTSSADSKDANMRRFSYRHSKDLQESNDPLPSIYHIIRSASLESANQEIVVSSTEDSKDQESSNQSTVDQTVLSCLTPKVDFLVSLSPIDVAQNPKLVPLPIPLKLNDSENSLTLTETKDDVDQIIHSNSVAAPSEIEDNTFELLSCSTNPDGKNGVNVKEQLTQTVSVVSASNIGSCCGQTRHMSSEASTDSENGTDSKSLISDTTVLLDNYQSSPFRHTTSLRNTTTPTNDLPTRHAISSDVTREITEEYSSSTSGVCPASPDNDDEGNGNHDNGANGNETFDRDRKRDIDNALSNGLPDLSSNRATGGMIRSHTSPHLISDVHLYPKLHHLPSSTSQGQLFVKEEKTTKKKKKKKENSKLCMLS